ncbi:MAG: flippase [Gemmatimonadaceae bacterium]
MTAVRVPPPSRALDVAPADAGRDEMRQGVANAVKLGASLVATWGIALGLRVIIPRYLGPEAFGRYQFADSFTTLVLLVTSFGLSMHLIREVSRRPEYASEVLGGLLAVRLAASAVVMAVVAAVFWQLDRPPETRWLVVILGVQTVVFMLNGLATSLLQASGRVGGLAITNVVSKVLWGAGIAVAIAARAGTYGIAFALLASEAIRAAVLFRLARRHLGYRLRLSWGPTVAALASAAPFFVNELAYTVNSKLDMSVMSFLVPEREVGWYGAAMNVAGITLLMTPLVGSILIPILSRAAERSEEEAAELSRRSLQYVVALSVPITLFVALGADPLVRLLFGPAFAPAARSLQVLAPMFVLTYAAILGAVVLNVVGRGWTVTRISLATLLITPPLYLLLIPRAATAMGPGGAGVGAAAALVACETFVVAAQAVAARRFLYDRRVGAVLLKSLLIAGAVALLDVALRGFGSLRFLPEIVLYGMAAVGLGLVDVATVIRFVRGLVKGRRGAYA